MINNLYNPIFAFIIIIISCLSSFLILKITSTKVESHKYETIDGLRGFLAISVFIHHSSIWYVYLHNQRWELPHDSLYSQLGQTSVAFFFMITSFLFVSKLLSDKKFIWKDFYISRIFRLTPMYYVSLLVIIIIVFIDSQWRLDVSITDFLKSILKWLGFTYFGVTPINGKDILIINAGIIWTLPYEWLFYFFLPILSLVISKKNRPSIIIFSFSILMCAIFYVRNDLIILHLCTFLGGMVAPFILKYTSIQSLLNTNKIIKSLISILILICGIFILVADQIFPYHYHIYLRIIFITIIFTAITLGNSFFGILRLSFIKLLGEISYSTYLIHGIFIYITFHFILGFEVVKQLSVVYYWGVIFIITPIVVLFSYLGYTFIEKPMINYSKKHFINKRNN